MIGSYIAFGLLSLLAIIAGWLVFRFDSMVRATFSLLTSFLAVACLLLLLDSEFMFAITFLMMLGEMVIMAMFMVAFMMNPAGLNPMNMVHQPRLAAAAGGVAFVALAGMALVADFPERTPAANADVVRALGTELLGDSMLVFESAGVALLATMIGVVVLSARTGRFGPSDEGSCPPGLMPGGPPAGEPNGAEDKGGGHGHHH